MRTLRACVARADVVHVQDAIYATSLPALLIARRHRVASVLTQHVAFVPQRSSALDAVQRLANATLGRGARLATAVATLNPAVASWVGRQWRIADPRVLPVGIPPPAAAPDRLEVRRWFGLPDDRFVALFVGRDVPKKGLDVFLGASDPAYDLVAVTDRPAVPASATIIPFMEPERLQLLLSCVDAFVLPSEGEGFPISLQEALSRGLPAVTTWQAGYEHYLAHDDVLVVDRSSPSVREALLRLAGDQGLREALHERSLAASERNFGLERFVSAYEQLYDEVRSRPGSPSGA
jgi:glycosyltransferase involved in cell wall biosynthesis